MSYETRATNIVNEIIGSNPADDRYERIFKGFVADRQDLQKLFIRDTENPTAEEEARVFIEALMELCKETVGSPAKRSKYKELSSQISDAVSSAQSDFDVT